MIKIKRKIRFKVHVPDKALLTAAHVLNHAPRKNLDWKTPFELMFGCKPEVSYFRVFGCRAWVLDDQAKKWDPKVNAMIFVGYEIASKAYQLWDPKNQKIVVSTNVKFDEMVLPNKPALTPIPAKPIPSTSKKPPSQPLPK